MRKVISFGNIIYYIKEILTIVDVRYGSGIIRY